MFGYFYLDHVASWPPETMAEVEGDGERVDLVSTPAAAVETSARGVMANFLGVDCGVVDSSAHGLSASISVTGGPSCSTSGAGLQTCKPMELTEANVQSLLHVQASTSSSSAMGSDLPMAQSKGSDAELSSTTSTSTTKQGPMKGIFDIWRIWFPLCWFCFLYNYKSLQLQKLT